MYVPMFAYWIMLLHLPVIIMQVLLSLLFKPTTVYLLHVYVFSHKSEGDRAKFSRGGNP